MERRGRTGRAGYGFDSLDLGQRFPRRIHVDTTLRVDVGADGLVLEKMKEFKRRRP